MLLVTDFYTTTAASYCYSAILHLSHHNSICLSPSIRSSHG